MKRLYTPIKDYPVYNNAVDRYMIESPILNGGSEVTPSIHTIFWDKKNIEAQLLELIGDKSGKYFRNGEYLIAVKPHIENKIKELEKRFEDYKIERRNQGYTIPTEIPGEMLHEYYLLQARLTVVLAEIDELNRRLSDYKAIKKDSDDSEVLKFGLRCVGKNHGLSCENPDLVNVLKIIDGQKVKLTDEGFLIINDDRSPYSGMLVSDYRKLAKDWLDQQHRKENERFIKYQEQCKAEGKPIPMQPPVKSMSFVSRASLPAFPVWAKNYLKEKSVNET